MKLTLPNAEYTTQIARAHSFDIIIELRLKFYAFPTLVVSAHVPSGDDPMRSAREPFISTHLRMVALFKVRWSYTQDHRTLQCSMA
jgi:hypothetical protein